MYKRFLRGMCNAVFNQINEEVFNNELPPIKFRLFTRIKRERTYALYYDNKIVIFYKELKGVLRFFPHQIFAIVAHEMIHHAQAHYGQGFGHNTAFFRHFAKRMGIMYNHKIEAYQTQYI